MLVSRSAFHVRSFHPSLSLLLLCVTAGRACAQVPANYKGPTLFGVCVYIAGDTSYYSNLFSTSGFYKIKAQEAFRNYALQQLKSSPIKSSGCRWSTSQEEVTTQKEADKRLLGLAGRSSKGVETGWSFTPTVVQPTQPSSTNTSATRVATPTTRTGTSTNQQPTPVASAAPVSQSGTSTSVGTSTASSPQQTVKDSLAASKSSAVGSMNDAVATTMGTVTSGATSAIKGMFSRKPKTSGSAPEKAASQSSQDAPRPAPLGVLSTESPQVATAESQRIQGVVADVVGNDVIINVGTQAGVRVGMKLVVMHVARTVKDPVTGKVLRTVEDRIGDLTVLNADATSAAGKFAGSTAAKVGDTARSPVP